MKIIGITVGTQLPKPNFDQTDPKKGDYIKGDRSFLKSVKTINGVAPDVNGNIAIEVDATLSEAGVAADAKAVGDLIGETPVSAQISNAMSTQKHVVADISNIVISAERPSSPTAGMLWFDIS